MKKLALALLSLWCGPALAQQPVVGFDSGPAVAQATAANASHAAGTSVGGLFSVPFLRIPGGSGIITQFALSSQGGSTGTYVVRLWRKSPANTTCTDNSAFAGNFVTDDRDLITPPFSVTLAAPASTTGDANTYGSSQGQTWDVSNGDGTQYVYVCLVTTATDTADQNKIVRVMLSGPQN